MNASELKRRLKRNWKKWKRRIGATALSVIIATLAWWGIHLSKEIESLLYSEPQIAMETLQYLQNTVPSDKPKEVQYLLQSLNGSNKVHRVVIQKNYICGQEEMVMGQMSSDKIMELLHQNPTWIGHFDDNEDVWLTELVEDLSPMCKEKAYMSMDAKANLTLYDGPPKQEKVLKTFFQLDINSMESALPEGVLEQLYEGIRIQDLDEYNSVISTFSDFAQEYTENVMKRTE